MPVAAFTVRALTSHSVFRVWSYGFALRCLFVPYIRSRLKQLTLRRKPHDPDEAIRPTRGMQPTTASAAIR
jgi:hypothetical protein